eukprot:6681295-Alexandrium_andersonii.AAC.1
MVNSVGRGRKSSEDTHMLGACWILRGMSEGIRRRRGTWGSAWQWLESARRIGEPARDGGEGNGKLPGTSGSPSRDYGEWLRTDGSNGKRCDGTHGTGMSMVCPLGRP